MKGARQVNDLVLGVAFPCGQYPACHGVVPQQLGVISVLQSLIVGGAMPAAHGAKEFFPVGCAACEGRVWDVAFPSCVQARQILGPLASHAANDITRSVCGDDGQALTPGKFHQWPVGVFVDRPGAGILDQFHFAYVAGQVAVQHRLPVHLELFHG